MIVMDVGEWSVWSKQQKCKFLVMMDAATKFKAVVPLFTYDMSFQRVESSQHVVEAVAKHWLAEKPKPVAIIPDNALSMTSAAFTEFCNQNNIWLCPPASKEPWAHGLAEKAVQEVKHVAEKIHVDDETLSPETCLALAASGLNQRENVKGFTPFQWVYGQQFQLSDEDSHTHAQLQADSPEFTSLLAKRVSAEALARKTRADLALTRLANSSVRQPLREFKPSQLVKVWRRYLPHEARQGRRGGFHKSATLLASDAGVSTQVSHGSELEPIREADNEDYSPSVVGR